jgi:hypothetical protein
LKSAGKWDLEKRENETGGKGDLEKRGTWKTEVRSCLWLKTEVHSQILPLPLVGPIENLRIF